MLAALHLNAGAVVRRPLHALHVLALAGYKYPGYATSTVNTRNHLFYSALYCCSFFVACVLTKYFTNDLLICW